MRRRRRLRAFRRAAAVPSRRPRGPSTFPNACLDDRLDALVAALDDALEVVLADGFAAARPRAGAGLAVPLVEGRVGGRREPAT
jgi:hypothetical protein